MPKTWLIAFAATGVAGFRFNALGTGSVLSLDAVGVLILLALTAVALVLAKLVPVDPTFICTSLATWASSARNLSSNAPARWVWRDASRCPTRTIWPMSAPT